MSRAEKRSSNTCRQRRRLMRPMFSTAAAASSIVSTMKPVSPSVMTSATEPFRKATTGVPQARASIMARPKGSGQSMGNSSARACPSTSFLPASSTSPMNSTSGC